MTDQRPSLDDWSPWTPDELAARLKHVAVPWYIAGGWAIDLFLGRQTRDHEDIEIGIPRDRFDEVASAFADCDIHVVGDGLEFPPPPTPQLLAEHHQTWVRDRQTGSWRLDILREPSHQGMWVARRDPRIRLAYADLIRHNKNGVPYGAPEVILLFKAKAARAKDEEDLTVVLPHLDERPRQWLRSALELAHPGHAWIARLRA